MHRSGTSALTRVLSLCGAALPARLIEPASRVNETGFWEPRELVALHDEILAAAGSHWHDVRRFPDAWFGSDAAAIFRQRLENLIAREFGAAPLLVVKDPRLCRLLPLWRSALARLGIAPLVVVPVRNPLEVAASLEERDGFGEGHSLVLWLGHFLAAEQHSRDLPRCFVAYDRLLTDWRGGVDRIGTSLGILWPRGPDAAAPDIEEFLCRTLRHHAQDPDTLFARPDIPWHVKETYRWATIAATDRPPPTGVLDRIQAEVLQAEPVFGLAIGALDAYARQLSEDRRRWIDVAVERYAMIEHLSAEVARLRVLTAETRISETSRLQRVLAAAQNMLRRWHRRLGGR